MSQISQWLIAGAFILSMALAGFGMAHYLGRKPKKQARKARPRVVQSTRNSPSSRPAGLSPSRATDAHITAPLRVTPAQPEAIVVDASQQAVDSAFTGLDAPNPHEPGSAEAALWTQHYEKVYTEWAGQKQRTRAR